MKVCICCGQRILSTIIYCFLLLIQHHIWRKQCKPFVSTTWNCVVVCCASVCETIQSMYPNMHRLVSNGQRVFVKSSMRIYLFKNKNPNPPLPPAHIVTHWGTLLSPVLYYPDKFDSVKSVVDELEKDDASLKRSFRIC